MTTESIAQLPILPEDLFSQKIIGNPSPYDKATYPKRYMICWNDTPATDGAFVLVIHPTQMFLRSSHDNPNPDRIYWLAALSPAQYDAVIAFLERYNGRVLSGKDVWEWEGYKVFRLTKAKQSPWMTGNDWDAWHRKVDKAIKANMVRILRELNKGLPKGVPRLNMPSPDPLYTHGIRIDDV